MHLPSYIPRYRYIMDKRMLLNTLPPACYRPCHSSVPPKASKEAAGLLTLAGTPPRARTRPPLTMAMASPAPRPVVSLLIAVPDLPPRPSPPPAPPPRPRALFRGPSSPPPPSWSPRSASLVRIRFTFPAGPVCWLTR
ncbi:hypothetical protein Vafri_21719 [Volvox africanus]|uniref:Uncharacterized protein n=1 Tax=Volvox africanus TaxID=51714 RepID=A0A8J4BT23_9CHLO|nr:hypothetical protein Vafri_21719 [Volvox africanus]